MERSEFEKISIAFDRHLTSSRMKIRSLERREESELDRLLLNYLEQEICVLRDANNEALRQRTWEPLINALAHLDIVFSTPDEAEEFIKQTALERLRREKGGRNE